MSEVHKFSGNGDEFGWEGVDGLPLTDEGLKFASKHVLIGDNEGAPNYIMRYFHLKPAGHSKLERHPQEHEIIVLHGVGEIQIADTSRPVGPFDVAFIEGGELHQFRAAQNHDLGFICIIPKPG